MAAVISPVMKDFGVSVVPMAQRPDVARWQGDEVYELAWLFTTRDGSWDVDAGKPGSITPEARARFLKSPNDPEYCADGGGDHNLFVAVIGRDGKLMQGKGCWWWSDGLAKLGDPNYTAYNQRNTDGRGWANIPDWAIYDPAVGPGPWCMCPYGLSDVVQGMGMPWRWHVSFFGVWQARPAKVTPPPNPEPGPTTDVDLSEVLLELRGLRGDVQGLAKHLGGG